MILRDRQFKSLLIFVGLLLLVGAVFYSHFEHWSFFNALYFSVITLTTVGYGDFTPHTAEGKAFTMIYIIVGVGIILGFINVVARHATKRYMRQSEGYMERYEAIMERILAKALKKGE
jgi:voltage-gated potassium channel Kch